jgi:hypothetical protein
LHRARESRVEHLFAVVKATQVRQLSGSCWCPREGATPSQPSQPLHRLAQRLERKRRPPRRSRRRRCATASRRGRSRPRSHVAKGLHSFRGLALFHQARMKRSLRVAMALARQVDGYRFPIREPGWVRLRPVHTDRTKGTARWWASSRAWMAGRPVHVVDAARRSRREALQFREAAGLPAMSAQAAPITCRASTTTPRRVP